MGNTRTHRGAVHPEPALAQDESHLGPSPRAAGQRDALGVADVAGALQGLSTPPCHAMDQAKVWAATHHRRSRRHEPQAPRRERPGRVRLLHAQHAHCGRDSAKSMSQ